MTRPVVVRVGRVRRGGVFERVESVVVDVSGGHQSRFNGGRAPVRVPSLEQSRDAAHVGARHGSTGQDVELHSPTIRGQARRTQIAGPRGENVHSGSHQIGLENLEREK
ncbi:hypothetical protein PanWU01x14_084430, partial [Parasponia andersonii]